jgi:hypothetical protein
MLQVLRRVVKFLHVCYLVFQIHLSFSILVFIVIISVTFISNVCEVLGSISFCRVAVHLRVHLILCRPVVSQFVSYAVSNLYDYSKEQNI